MPANVSSQPNTESATFPAGTPASPRWLRMESLLENASDWLNAILVKEARQSLKSRQFVVTFFLLLIAVWIWSIWGVTYFIRDNPHSDHGATMFMGYFVALCFALFVIVPFSAYRSLVAEREDGTYELLSITTLSARQIVVGKLASAALQMLIYLSALAPCIAFTYLLRGVDIFSLGISVVAAAVCSMFLSMACLSLGTVSRKRQWNGVFSVLMVLGLFYGYAFSMLVFGGELLEVILRSSYSDYRFWYSLAMIISVVFSFGWLAIEVAAANLTFVSENRSTRLRWVVLAVQAVLMNFFAWAALMNGPHEELFGANLAWVFLSWAFVGIIVAGESNFLSQRARRTLPQSVLARVFCTWLAPGARTGYVFVVLSATASVIFVVAFHGCLFLWMGRNGGSGNWTEVLRLEWMVIWLYFVIYLGVLNLVLDLLRKFTRVRMATSFIVGAALVLLGMVVPFFIQAFQNRIPYTYSLYFIGNPFATIDELRNGIGPSLNPASGAFPIGEILSFTNFGFNVLLFLLASTCLVFVWNLILAAHEVKLTRQSTPERVLAESPAAKPSADSTHANPWN